MNRPRPATGKMDLSSEQRRAPSLKAKSIRLFRHVQRSLSGYSYDTDEIWLILCGGNASYPQHILMRAQGCGQGIRDRFVRLENGVGQITL